MKNWDSSDGHDWEEKKKCTEILNHFLGYRGALFDETIFVNKTTFEWQTKQPTGYESKEDLLRCWEVFKPDILIKKHNMIIEMDGDFHFNMKKGVKQTQKRNQYYEYMKIKFVWFYSGNENKEASFLNLSLSTILGKIKSA